MANMEVKTAQVVKTLSRSVQSRGDDEVDNIVGAAEGFRQVNGKRTGEWCAVVYVRKKKPVAQLLPGESIPSKIDGVKTDVQEVGEEFRPLVVDLQSTIDGGGLRPQELTDRFRPCPGGYSIGHRQITAGTLGCYVSLGGAPHVLSNNHVLAATNEASPGDFIYQPGPLDGGSNTANLFGTLREWVEINFRASSPRPPKKNTAIAAWKAWMWPANALSGLLGCTNRLKLHDSSRVRVVGQPTPNLVDAAISTVDEAFVDLDVYNIGRLRGIRDPMPGQRVRKSGRTTEYTEGSVTGLGGSVTVNYGAGKGNADFEDQIIIEADSGEFSAGGDSGSAIVDQDNFLVGVLFAGGGGRTIACKATHVSRLLGISIL